MDLNTQRRVSSVLRQNGYLLTLKIMEPSRRIFSSIARLSSE
jgi:hypothetical protein